MIVKWKSSSKAILEVDETEYMMLASALTMCLNYPLPFDRIHQDFVNGLDIRQDLKQKERKNQNENSYPKTN